MLKLVVRGPWIIGEFVAEIAGVLGARRPSKSSELALEVKV